MKVDDPLLQSAEIGHASGTWLPGSLRQCLDVQEAVSSRMPPLSLDVP